MQVYIRKDGIISQKFNKKTQEAAENHPQLAEGQLYGRNSSYIVCDSRGQGAVTGRR